MNSDKFTKNPKYKHLREMMNDPKYWRDRNPSYVALIEEGFQQLAEEGQQANEAGLNGPIHEEDSEIAHLTPGEVIIPRSAQTQEIMQALYQVLGDDLAKYTAGSGAEQINPTSGLPAFADHLEGDIERGLAGWADKSPDEQMRIKRKIQDYQKVNPGKAMTYLGRIANTQENPKAEWTTFDDDDLGRKITDYDNKTRFMDEAAYGAGIAAARSSPGVGAAVGTGAYLTGKYVDWQSEQYNKLKRDRRR